jgi:hypothetical protein
MLVAGILIPVAVAAPPAPSLSVTPTAIDFGYVAPGPGHAAQESQLYWLKRVG